MMLSERRQQWEEDLLDSDIERHGLVAQTAGMQVLEKAYPILIICKCCGQMVKSRWASLSTVSQELQVLVHQNEAVFSQRIVEVLLTLHLIAPLAKCSV